MNSTINAASWLPVTGNVLITGGAGFIGTNLAQRLLVAGQPVTILDNLSRRGVQRNLDSLKCRFGALLTSVDADIRDRQVLSKLLPEVSAVFHFAGQVAVTASLQAPREDFEVNAYGTLNLLEALKAQRNPPPLVFTSTNKVYGALEWMLLDEEKTRYLPRDPEIRRRGLSETCPISFRSPYGCSKGAADQYVQDYANSFKLPTVVFRMSCIYGAHQYGTEDQGWVAHFLSQYLQGRRITIYGDGKQVRDLLYIDDLIDALLLAHQHIPSLSGRVFNIGGGPARAVSLLELLAEMYDLGLGSPEVKFAGWREGDQQYYVSDSTSFRTATGWLPKISVEQGIAQLHQWLVHSTPDATSFSLTA